MVHLRKIVETKRITQVFKFVIYDACNPKQERNISPKKKKRLYYITQQHENKSAGTFYFLWQC